MLSLHKAVEKTESIWRKNGASQTVDKLENEINANNTRNANNASNQLCQSLRWKSDDSQRKLAN